MGRLDRPLFIRSILACGLSSALLGADRPPDTLTWRMASDVQLRRRGAGLELVDGRTGAVMGGTRTAAGGVVVVGGPTDDTLEIDFAGGNPIPAAGLSYDGGGQRTPAGDALVLSGGRFETASFTFVRGGRDGHAGTIRLQEAGSGSMPVSVLSFAGLEPITMTGSAVDLVFNLPEGDGNNFAILEDDGVPSNGYSRIRSGNATFETTDFLNPSGTLTIATGNDGETVTVAGLYSGFTARINVNGGGGSDTLRLGNGESLRGGSFNGGAGADTLDYAAYTTPIAVNLGSNAPAPGFGAALDGAQEVPPSGSAATGTATLSYNSVARTFDIAVTVDGITPEEVTGFHIHRAAVGMNGPIFVDFGGSAGLVPSPGGFTFTATNVPLPAMHEAALLGALSYVNIHTPSKPGGLIRGQLYATGLFVAAPGTATGLGGVSSVENAVGGAGADSLVGSLNVDFLTGGDGNDVLVGARSNDSLIGGPGNDLFGYNNGDGSDVVDGSAGADLLQVSGHLTSADLFTLGANGTRLDFDRLSPGPFSLDIGTVETLTVNGIGGDDTFTVNALSGVSDLTLVNLHGGAGNDQFTLIPAPNTAIRAHGFDGTDTLDLDAACAHVDATGGTITVAGAQPITHSSVEDVQIASAVRFATATRSVAEAAGAANVVITRTGTANVSVDFATSNGTASAGSDYASTSGTRSFGPGEFSRTFQVPIVSDTLEEPNETVNVALGNLIGFGRLCSPQTLVLTIVDDDRPPVVLYEAKVDPAGTDEPFEYVEIQGPPGFSLTGFSFVSMEGDWRFAGTADLVVDLGTECGGPCSLGANGLLMIKSVKGGHQPPPGATTAVLNHPQFNAFGGTLENGSNTFLLIRGASMVEGNDYDSDDDGILEGFSGTIADAFGWSDGDFGDLVYGGVVLTQSAGIPHAATRFPTDLAPLSSSAWYNGNLIGSNSDVAYGTDVSANFPAGGVLTPGDLNTPAGDLIFKDGFEP